MIEAKRETYDLNEIAVYLNLPPLIFEPLREQLNAKYIKYVFGSKFFPGENYGGNETNLENRLRYSESFKEYQSRFKVFYSK